MASTSPTTSAPRRCGYSSLRFGHAAPHPEVEVVEGHGADAHAHLARARVGHVDGLADEDLGAAVLAQDDGFGLHGSFGYAYVSFA